MNVREQIFQRFFPNAALTECIPYGAGHINDTFLVTTTEGTRYILQRINHHIFRDVDGLMNNIVGVTEFIAKKKIALGKDPASAMRVIPTIDEKNYTLFEGNYYRLYNFIDKAVSINTVATPHQFYLSGIGFGQYPKYLDGYPAESLTESIPLFHNTRSRFENLRKAVNEDKVGRAKSVQKEIDFFFARESYADRILKLLEEKKIPLRVTHNDTKLNNVLIDLESDQPVAVIDLDTVMPGSILYDFGDSIRSGANTGEEDERDLSKVSFSLELFRSFATGFLGEVKDRLTETEKEQMAFGAILMTFECGMRFLTDHLEGDVYFKIHRENHNLDRARTQIKMVADMEKCLDDMNAIVYEVCNK